MKRKKIYCYDKEQNSYSFKTTAKSIFSEDYANTTINNGVFDHQTLENQLNIFFEQDFEKHKLNIVDLAENPCKNNVTKLESLYYLACYALIADVSFPDNKKQVDDGHNWLMLETARKIRLIGDEAQAQSIENSIAETKMTKYSNVVNYTEIAANRLARMGDLDFIFIS